MKIISKPTDRKSTEFEGVVICNGGEWYESLLPHEVCNETGASVYIGRFNTKCEAVRARDERLFELGRPDLCCVPKDDWIPLMGALG